MPMAPERWGEIEQMYHRVLGQPLEGRMSFLDRECAEDNDLRREVQRMLAVETNEGFLEVQALEGRGDGRSLQGTRYAP